MFFIPHPTFKTAYCPHFSFIMRPIAHLFNGQRVIEKKMQGRSSLTDQAPIGNFFCLEYKAGIQPK